MQEKMFFVEQSLGAEVHWFFVQAVQALRTKLYLPACTCFIIGIEASVRVTMHQLEFPGRACELNPSKTLSNRLLRDAMKSGLPVESLAFPNETEFLERLERNGKSKTNVEVVRVRHNLCHGNILDYLNTELGEQNDIFTPECCKDLSYLLLEISKNWAARLGAFRREVFSRKT